ncbi:SPK domain-containing protein [Caenorhabditis elegans]|uniref:Double-strand telomeric DNA-binding proteins 1 n=1 Tax=Caenorhabditis elegans TaxID=6239 RepID=O62329_CAEEL|nr:SPK domain-containing protein [Caenorhabditis elegans]BCO38674.1 double-strand telomeric DNA-binding proteins 1 [Caenorhabditis elegans]CAB05583.1 SPK domain-containing protein [Caenorhabditis elegans]|eukprot:NP_496986.1 Uncharacterized protein CELE_R06A4.2 [Caenorhabditis elegans]
MSSRAKKNKPSRPSFDDELTIWEFIHENTCNMEMFNEVNLDLFKEYLQEHESVFTAEQLYEYYVTTMKATLYKCEMEPEKMLTLYKNLEIEVTPHVEILLEAKFKTVLRVDSNRRLQKFSDFSARPVTCGSVSRKEKVPETIPETLEETVPETVPEPERLQNRMPLDVEISDSFEKAMWNHVSQNAARLTGKFLMTEQFWAELLQSQPNIPIKSAHIVLHHFNEMMLENLWKQAMDPDAKLQILKDLSVPLSYHQRKWILDNDRLDVALSLDGYVVSWDIVRDQPAPRSKILTWTPRTPMRNRSPSLMVFHDDIRPPSPIQVVSDPTSSYFRSRASTDQPGPSSHRSQSANVRETYAPKKIQKREKFTLDDHMCAWKFVHEKIVEAKKEGVQLMPKGIAFWRDFVKVSRSSKSATNWSSHFRKIMCPALHEMPLHKRTILYLLKHIDIEIDEEAEKLIERKFNVKLRVGTDRSLISYRLLDAVVKGEVVEKDKKSEEAREIEAIDVDDGDADVKQEVVEKDGKAEEAPEHEAMDVEDDDEDLDETIPLESDEQMMDENLDTSVASKKEAMDVDELSNKMTDAVNNLQKSITESTNETTVLEGAAAAVILLSESLQNFSRVGMEKSSSDVSSSSEPVSSAEPAAAALVPSEAGQGSRDVFTSQSDSTIPESSSFDELLPNSCRVKMEKSYSDIPRSAEPVFKVPMIPNRLSHSASNGLKPAEISPILVDYDALNSQVVQQVLDDADDKDLELIHEALEKAFGNQENWTDKSTAKTVTIGTIIKAIETKFTGISREVLLEQKESIVEEVLGNVENEKVLEVRTEAIREALIEADFGPTN